MHTVELLLDERLESGVRVLWDRLRDAGLPSLATHAHRTNRPHLTLALRDVQAAVWSALAGADPWPPPSDWVPHVSLALNVPASRREAARDLLATVPPARGHVVAARSYDTRTRSVVDL